jgi:hypothetical protein
VPLVAAAVCPHPPLIVPEIAVGAAAETHDLRTACDAAVAHLLRSGARAVVVVGADTASRVHRSPFRASLARWGVDVDVAPGADVAPGGADIEVNTGAQVPLSLVIGAWLLRRAPVPAGTDWTMLGVAVDATPESCRALGAEHRSQLPWAMLVMGDGSACRGPKAPGYDDPRAEAYDAGVSRALADADAGALLDLDPVLSAELKVAGRAPWQVLAGATRATGHAWRGEVTYDAAPYGVGYLVARWTPA